MESKHDNYFLVNSYYLHKELPDLSNVRAPLSKRLHLARALQTEINTTDSFFCVSLAREWGAMNPLSGKVESSKPSWPSKSRGELAHSSGSHGSSRLKYNLLAPISVNCGISHK